MLTAQDNDILSRVGPGTPMGDLMRQYWLPAFLSWEIEPDGAPLRVGLLGEALVAFRDTEGRIGLVADNCPHRGASMWFGRNEAAGLRCVYHGWKFDVTGRCTDMPNEPPESSAVAPSHFRHKVSITAYPCVERNGVVWAYMGPRRQPPAPPELPWATLPENHCYISTRVQECNWAQAVEGGIDSSHVSFLHSWIDPSKRPLPPGGTTLPPYAVTDRHPHFEALDADYGVVIGARRDAEAETYYWRITQFLMPFYTMIPGPLDPEGTVGGHAWVPMDDTHTLTWSISWNYSRPLTPEEVQRMQSFPGGGIHYGSAGMKPASTQPAGKWMPALCRENDFGLDRELMKTKLYIGIEQFGTQDSAIQETMGAIYDRTKEHLGSADTGIIRYRRRLIGAAKALREQGICPPGVEDPDAYRVRSASLILPRSANWFENARDRLIAR